jgi:hypothetical protein
MCWEAVLASHCESRSSYGTLGCSARSTTQAPLFPAPASQELLNTCDRAGEAEEYMDASDYLGPVDFLAVEFPSGRMNGNGFRLVRELVEAGTIVVLDLEFILKGADGSITRLAVEDVPTETPQDVSMWSGQMSGILDEADLALIADAIAPGSLAGVMVYENAAARPIMAEITASGARLIGSGRIDHDDLTNALDLPLDD